MRRWWWAVLLVLLSGCAQLVPREPVAPVEVEWLVGDGRAGEGRRLIVFLPGRWSGVGEFGREGFGEMVQRLAPETDAVAVDLHLGYYKDRSAVVRLRSDVVAPARRAGYGEIWFVGTSLGGLGSLLYGLEEAGGVERFVLLAPFLGEEGIVNEIEQAGGLRAWEPGVIGEEDYQRKLWSGMRGVALGQRGDFPEMWLGFGEGDRLARSNGFFAQEVLEGRAVTVDGGHDWEAWRRLFEIYLRSVDGE